MDSFTLLYHPRAVKNLKRIHPTDQKKIIKKLEQLAKEPTSISLNVRKLVNTGQSYRLRVGNLRVIYEVDKGKRIIYVWDIDYRGNIY